MQSEEKGERHLSLWPEGREKLSSYKKVLWDLPGSTEPTGPLLYRSHWEDVHAVSSIGLTLIYLSRRLHEPCLSQQTDGSREPVHRRMNCGIEEELRDKKWVRWNLMPMLSIAGCVLLWNKEFDIGSWNNNIWGYPQILGILVSASLGSQDCEFS